MSGNSKCTLASAVMCSPIGNYLVEACDEGIHSVSLESGVNNDNFKTKGDPKVRIIKGGGPTGGGRHPVLRKFILWLQEYFLCNNIGGMIRKVPVCKEVADPSGTFRERVWLTLMEDVKFGQTVTYDILHSTTG